MNNSNNNTLSCSLNNTEEVEEAKLSIDIKNILLSTSDNVETILISDSDIINDIMDSIIDKLSLVNKLSKIKLLHCLMRYVNKKADFLYNEDSHTLIGIKLKDEELSTFINEINKILLKDKHLIIKSGINKKKDNKISYLRKINLEKEKILKYITELELELYNINALLYRLEDKGLNIMGTELEKSIIQNKIKQEESKVIELDVVIENTENIINNLDKEKNKLTHQENKEYFNSNISSNILSFSKEYILPKIERKNDSTIFLNIGEKGKKIILGLSIIAGFSIFIKTAINIPQNIKISEHSQKINNTSSINIPDEILKDISKLDIREVTGFENNFIIGVDTFPLEVVYPGNTIENDIILNKILITSFDVNGIKQEPVIIKTYFYRKNITNKQITLSIKDASAEGQIVKLTIKK